MSLGRWIPIALALVLAASCDSSETVSDKNTNWLGGCVTSRDCRSGLECIRGVCTRVCATDAGCVGLSQDAVCVAPPGDEPCLESVPAMCTVHCDGPRRCRAFGDALQCHGGACFPSSCSDAGGPGEPPDAGARDASADAPAVPSDASAPTPRDAAAVPPDRAVAPDAPDCGPGGCPPPIDAGSYEPYEIVTGRQAPHLVVSDGEFVYWIDVGPVEAPADVMILKCPVTGCEGPPVVLATNQNYALGIAVRDGIVYWVKPSAGEIMKCASAGCNGAPTPVATSQQDPQAVAVGTTDVFWTNWADSTVMRCPLPDCAGGPVVVASGQPYPSGIVVDGTSAFWANMGGGLQPNPNGSVATCENVAAGCGATPTVLAALTEMSPRRIAVDATTVVWTHYDSWIPNIDGRVYACARSGCSGGPTVIAAGQAEPYDVTVDNGFVYWTNYDPGNPTPGANVDCVLRCPVTGCGSGPEILAKDQQGPRGIAVDSNRIYWASTLGGRIVAMRKPARR